MTALRVFRRLSELLDVLIASPADGEVLTYSSASGNWENQAGGGGGAGGGVILKGPYTATHTTPSIGTDGALMTTVADGDIVLETLVYITTTWENSGGVYVYLGDPNVSPRSLWTQIADPFVIPGVSFSPPDGGPVYVGNTFLVGPGLSEGGVYVQTSNTVSAGALDLYLLVGTPE